MKKQTGFLRALGTAKRVWKEESVKAAKLAVRGIARISQVAIRALGMAIKLVATVAKLLSRSVIYVWEEFRYAYDLCLKSYGKGKLESALRAAGFVSVVAFEDASMTVTRWAQKVR